MCRHHVRHGRNIVISINIKSLGTNMIPDWAKEMNCAVTVCDKDGVILYMNDKAKETFARHGDLIGKYTGSPVSFLYAFRYFFRRFTSLSLR